MRLSTGGDVMRHVAQKPTAWQRSNSARDCIVKALTALEMARCGHSGDRLYAEALVLCVTATVHLDYLAAENDVQCIIAEVTR